ncbi:MAG: putative glycoside hydrolase [Ruminococcus sp.]|nr:putative glycoside hydrolase [Ruminococcus sp.]
MKLKNKGRKIYKTKEKNYYGKSPVGKFFSALLSVLLIGGVGFLGYSVAGPLIDYSRKQGDEEPETVSAMEEIPADTSSADDGKEEKKKPVKDKSIYRAVMLNEYDMASIEGIKTAIGRVSKQQDFEYIEVPLKLSNGKLTYKSSVQKITESDIKQSEIKLTDIVKAIKKEGYKPSAYISVFADNTIPDVYAQCGYMLSETVSAWRDADSHTWASPFSAEYKEYLSLVVAEMTKAGFEKIVCSDIAFPEFSRWDIEELNDNRLENPERYTFLENASDGLYNDIKASDADMFIEISACDLISGKAEIMQSEVVLADKIVLDINLDDIAGGVDTGQTVYEFEGNVSENVTKMLGLSEEFLDGYSIAVRISGKYSNIADIMRTADDIKEMGYTSFILG